MKQIVLFASGSGSNVENIATYFEGHPRIAVSAVFTNNKRARVLERCEKLGLSAFYFNRQAFYHSEGVMGALKALKPDLIVLAGFMWIIPKSLVEAFPGRIINIHPALLPRFGGKGMYGMHVHEAVRASGDLESGITIHFVNERYDEGAVIRQERVVIHPEETAEEIAEKVHQLEYRYYPKVIEQLLEQQ